MKTASTRFSPGEVCFIVLYADDELKVPVIQTLIFSESCIRADGGIDYRFKDIKPQEKSSAFMVQGEHVDELIVDRDGLIDRLRISRK